MAASQGVTAILSFFILGVYKPTPEAYIRTMTNTAQYEPSRLEELEAEIMADETVCRKCGEALFLHDNGTLCGEEGK